MKPNVFQLTLIVLLFNTLQAQITLENTYTIPANKGAGLSLIKLENSGQKYCLYEFKNRKLKLYNLNHSLYKTINIPALPKYRTTDSTVSIAYISENLFNLDNSIEFIAFDGQYDYHLTPSNYGSMIIANEAGSIMFSGDSLLPCLQRDATYYGYEGKGDFIFNTSSGTKMILFSYKTNTPAQKVYSLPGQLVAVNSPERNNLNMQLPYPNPGINSITLPYQLENNKEGRLVIYDLSGKLILEYKIDATFDNIIVDTGALAAGSYLFHVYSNDKILSTGKFMVTN